MKVFYQLYFVCFFGYAALSFYFSNAVEGEVYFKRLDIATDGNYIILDLDEVESFCRNNHQFEVRTKSGKTWVLDGDADENEKKMSEMISIKSRYYD